MKKTLYTLDLNPDVYKEITDLTYPLMKEYCRKIEAEFYIISDRKFPEFKSPTYEKCQVYQLSQDRGDEWSIFLDADALIHPETPDLTTLAPKDTVLHNGHDFAGVRWRYDRFFRRDGRHIGSPSWLCVASDWCIDLFKPLDDLTPEQAYANIFPTVPELKNGYEPWRLIEDYVFSRNIAKYGLKFDGFHDMALRNDDMKGDFFYHEYMKPMDVKIRDIKDTLGRWGML